MCLSVDTEDSLNFLEKNKNKEFVWVYKSLEPKDGEWVTPFLYTVVHKGIFTSKNPLTPFVNLTTPSKRRRTGRGAIHVYLNKKDAYVDTFDGGILIRAKAYIKDFIGCNYEDGEAAFRKIEIVNFNDVY
jgi:hypothetical protein